MSKFYLALLFCISSVSARSQILYGTTFYGGDSGEGTINKLIPASNNLTVIKSLASFESNPGRADLAQANNGKFYGMTWAGGKYKAGVIYSYDPATSTYSNVKDLEMSNGFPVGRLVQASDGKFYGVAVGGGEYQDGVIFSFDPANSAYAVVKEFDSTTGTNPSGGLILGKDGKLYGMTMYGGDSFFPGTGDGVIFSFDPANSTYTTLVNFNFVSGSNPLGSLMQASNGKIYGTTLMGGNNNVGVLFSFDPVSKSYAKLVDFDFGSGTNPSGSLVQASNGKLYGLTTSFNGTDNGAIFSFDPATSNYSKLIDFVQDKGASPLGGLTKSKSGKLYGLTTRGGNSDAGVVFSFDPSTQSYAKLMDLDNSTGTAPAGSLTEAKDGKLYGTTTSGFESTDDGVLFSFDPATTTYAKLKEFGVNKDGSNVSAGLIKARDGKLYGMTTTGGSNTLGVIFSIDPASSVYKKLVDFDFPSGAQPYGHLMEATDGKLYGMTTFGGDDSLINTASNTGVIFSFDPASSVYTTLLSFDSYNFSNGGLPYGSLIQATNGKLYGMTSTGGTGYRGTGEGVIFSFDPSSSKFTRLKDFAIFNNNGISSDESNGVYPYGDLLQASDGKFYGMTSGGGDNGVGVLFSYDPATSVYMKLEQFDTTNGANPYGSLIQATDGKLYGMTWGGGSNSAGVIFSYDISHSTFSKLKDFDFINGGHPYGNLMQASDGKLYGMTSSGGANDYGVVFSLDPVSLSYTKLIDYDGSNGANPYFGAAFIELSQPIPTGIPPVNGMEEFKVFPNPNNGQFSVRMKLNTVNDVSFQLFNLMGQIIYKSPAYQVSGEQSKEIKGPQLVSGVYYLQTQVGKSSFTQKIVVQR